MLTNKYLKVCAVVTTLRAIYIVTKGAGTHLFMAMDTFSKLIEDGHLVFLMVMTAIKKEPMMNNVLVGPDQTVVLSNTLT